MPAVRTDGALNSEDSENEAEVDEAFREFLYRQQQLSGEDEEDRRGTGAPRRRDQSFLPQPSSSSSSSSSSASEREEGVANAQSQASHHLNRWHELEQDDVVLKGAVEGRNDAREDSSGSAEGRESA